MRQLKIEQSITNREAESLSKYFTELSTIDMIDADQEIELTRRIRKGDEQALQALVKANLRFVVSVAKKYQNYGIPLIDLIEEGNIGLIRAAHRFDETRGFKFISYAVWWIRQHIQKAIQDNGKIVRLPSNKQGLMMKINRVSAEFFQEHSHNPDKDQLAELLGETKKNIVETMQSAYTVAALDEPIGEDGRTERSEQFSVEEHTNVEDFVFESSITDEVNRLLDKLKPNEQAIVKSVFGLRGETRISMHEVARRMGISVERVRQLKNKALARLRSFHPNYMRDYISYH
ncbi:RNA polymerase sigma factor RpoD/SigA [Flavobacteriales bacterium]|nr:RNA polymerase sigma factor RpoD/SigA [Flavobacteriales bacterium]MDC3336653.1 RNA polymerase sigma factor RpoD/SigA [Flavobacteriales bacterium]